MAGLIFWAVVGGLAGGFAKSVLWYEGAQSWLASISVGIVGGIAGGFLRTAAGPTDGFDLSSIGLVIVGASALLAAYNLLAQRRPAAAAGHRKAA